MSSIESQLQARRAVRSVLDDVIRGREFYDDASIETRIVRKVDDLSVAKKAAAQELLKMIQEVREELTRYDRTRNMKDYGQVMALLTKYELEDSLKSGRLRRKIKRNTERSDLNCIEYSGNNNVHIPTLDISQARKDMESESEPVPVLSPSYSNEVVAMSSSSVDENVVQKIAEELFRETSRTGRTTEEVMSDEATSSPMKEDRKTGSDSPINIHIIDDQPTPTKTTKEVLIQTDEVRGNETKIQSTVHATQTSLDTVSERDETSGATTLSTDTSAGQLSMNKIIDTQMISVSKDGSIIQPKTPRLEAIAVKGVSYKSDESSSPRVSPPSLTSRRAQQRITAPRILRLSDPVDISTSAHSEPDSSDVVSLSMRRLNLLRDDSLIDDICSERSKNGSSSTLSDRVVHSQRYSRINPTSSENSTCDDEENTFNQVSQIEST